MQTSRFQLGLMASLALGLGLSLASMDAVGYPSGAAVSLGSNPVWSVGGVLTGDSSASIIEAPTDQAVVFTDVALSLSSTRSDCSAAVEIGLGGETATSLSDARLGRFTVGVNREGYGYTRYHPTQTIQLNAGGQLEPGEELKIYTDVKWTAYCNESDVRLSYILSGYYAQP